MYEMTVAQIADRLGEPEHRVQNVLRFHRDIKPARRVGIIRLFDQAAVERIAQVIQGLDARRKGAAADAA